MSRYFAAFDAAVAAAGYNAYHELIALGVPSLFVPMARDTDDQPARARYAERAGIGLAVDGPADPELESQLDRLLDPDGRSALAARLAELPAPDGAAAAAAWLGALAADSRDGAQTIDSRPKSPHRAGEPRRAGSGAGWRDFRRRWGTFALSVPSTVGRIGRQTLTEPRARTLVLALGIEPDQVPAAVTAALAEAGDEPRRTVVVTDQLSVLGELRELGVGVEHVPARGSRQAELAGCPYEEFLARRLELIRAERPEPRRMIVAPGGASVP